MQLIFISAIKINLFDEYLRNFIPVLLYTSNSISIYPVNNGICLFLFY